MRRTRLAFCIAAALSAVPIAASAQQAAYALSGAEIYAGPGQDYPMVARIGPGVSLRVQGCLQDYTWCDVTFGPNRLKLQDALADCGRPVYRVYRARPYELVRQMEW